MLAVLVFVGFVCFFVLVVVVGVFCVVCFGGLFFWLCGWFGLFFGVCLVVVVVALRFEKKWAVINLLFEAVPSHPTFQCPTFFLTLT